MWILAQKEKCMFFGGDGFSHIFTQHETSHNHRQENELHSDLNVISQHTVPTEVTTCFVYVPELFCRPMRVDIPRVVRWMSACCYWVDRMKERGNVKNTHLHRKTCIFLFNLESTIFNFLAFSFFSCIPWKCIFMTFFIFYDPIKIVDVVCHLDHKELK